MKATFSWSYKLTLLFFLVFFNGYSQFSTNPPGGTSPIYTRGNVNIGTPMNTANKLNVTGNSLFTGNTRITGTSQIANLGLGIAPNTLYRLYLTGNSLFNGNIGIGAAPSNTATTKLLLSSGSNGISGLNFANLNANFSTSVLNNNKVLNVDAAGNVILSKNINSISHTLIGNTLTTTINGVVSNSISLASTGNSNIFNSDGILDSERKVNLNNNKLFFNQSLVMAVGINPAGNVNTQGAIFGVYDHSTNVNVEPNFKGDGIFNVGSSIGRQINHLTTGTNTTGNWTQSSDIVNNQSFNYHINPLGGNVGIGVTNATAQLHTKNSVRFENLPVNTNPTYILGTDSNGNVFNVSPSQTTTAVGDYWALDGNANATSASFLGTTTNEALRFKVNNFERLQITNSGRFHISNAPGSSSNVYFGQNAGNDSGSGGLNVAIGSNALFSNTSGGANDAIGYEALTANTTGYNNTAHGFRSLYSNTSGNGNIAIGVNSGKSNLTGFGNAFLGAASGELSTGNRNTFVGIGAGYTLTAGDSNVLIGNFVEANISNTGSNQLNIANKIYGSGVGSGVSVGIGVPNPQANLHSKGTFRLEALPSSSTLPANILGTDGSGNVYNFNPSLLSTTATGDFWSLDGNANATATSFLGTTNSEALRFRVQNAERLQITNTGRFQVSNSAGGNTNLYFGQDAGNDASTFWNVGIGPKALFNNTGNANTAIGDQALSVNTSGTGNQGIGYRSLISNTIGGFNAALGFFAGNANVAGNHNVFVGSSAGNGSKGDKNIFLGSWAGYTLTSGDNNVFIGSWVTPNISTTGSDQLNIADKIYGKGNGVVSIGIGVPDPQANFHSKGTARLENLPNSSTIPNNILGTDGVGNVFNFNPSLLIPAATTNSLVSNTNTMTSTVDGVASSAPIINSISNAITGGDQLTTTINGVSSAPITLPPDDLTTEVVDSYIGLRLKPIDPNVNGFNFKKNTNTVIGYRAINTGTGNAAVSSIGTGINPTDNYKDLTYVCHFGPAYYVSKFAGNGALLTDRDLFIGSYGDNKSVDFVLGNGFTNTQSKFKIDNANISSLSYPSTRNDASITTPVNFIYTDANGKFLSAPISSIINSVPNVNIYNSDGSLISNRFLNTNHYNLKMGDVEKYVNINPDNYNSNIGSLLAVNTWGDVRNPNFNNVGHFSIGAPKISNYLTQGVDWNDTWIQSSTGSTPKSRTHLPLKINPKAGNVAIGPIGTTEPTAQLHTVNSVRFENLEFKNDKPNAVLGTDVDGNVYNYDPSMFGSGSSGDAWLLNGNLDTNPGTAPGQNFVGTIDAKDLVFGVNSSEKLRITQTGRFQLFGWAPSSGANSAYNIFIGGGNDTSIDSNIAIGVGSMINNTTGRFNTTLGFSALENNSTGEGNTSFGFQSMRMNTSGSSNVSIGVNSMFNNTVGINNVSVGTSTLEDNINGSNNVTMGTWAGLHLNSGNSNVMIGTAAGTTLNSGTANILIGDSVQTMTSTSSNELNIGNWIFGKNGQIAIGSFNNLPQSFITNSDYQLIVKRGIRTEKVRVDIASVKNWADYVFEDDYKLMSLKELDQYIKTNGHLPNIPTSEEVVKQGVDLAEMNAKLLEKVEELTLYTIELNKKNESQQKNIDDLISRLEKLEKNNKQ